MVRLKIFVFALIGSLMLTIPAHPASKNAQSGWLKEKSFYRPFVKVSSCRGKIALFINPKGRIYKGICRRDRSGRGYFLSPRKRFLYREPLRYFILRVNGFDPPAIVRTGILDD